MNVNRPNVTSPTSCFPTPPRKHEDMPLAPEGNPHLPVDQFEPSRAQDLQQFRQACTTLLDNFDQVGGMSLFGNGTIDMNELYAAAQGQRGGPDVQQAAQWLLAHPAAITELETRGSRNPDGKISTKDLTLEIGALNRSLSLEQLRYDPRLPQFADAVNTLARYAPTLDTAGSGFFQRGPDGKISKADLDAVITGVQYPPELRQAAFFMSMNPDLMSVTDTAAKGGQADGVISFDDLGTMLGNLTDLMQSRLEEQLKTMQFKVPVQG